MLNLMNDISKKKTTLPEKITNNNVSFCQFKNGLGFASESIFASEWYFKSKWPYVCFKPNSEKGKLANCQTQMSYFSGKIESC